jgi:hypothetical protein
VEDGTASLLVGEAFDPEEVVKGRRAAVAEDLRVLADDLKRLFESATGDPDGRRRKERRWGLLHGALATLATIAARRAAGRAWTILTGEEPPTQRHAPRAPRQTPATADVERTPTEDVGAEPETAHGVRSPGHLDDGR